MQGVIFLLAAQHLDGAVEFGIAPNEWIVVGQVVIDAKYKVAPAAISR